MRYPRRDRTILWDINKQNTAQRTQHRRPLWLIENKLRFPINWLIAYYKLDETSGTKVSDSVGSNDWTASWATIVTGKINNGREFDWTNDKITISTIISVKTISMRLQNANITSSSNMLFNADWTNYIWQVHPDWYMYNNLWNWNKNISHWISTKNTWYHIVIIADWTNLKLYNNWVLKGKLSESNYLFVKNIWNWGSTYPGYWWNWKLDEIWIWSRVLSDWWASVWDTAWWEVAELYNSWNWLAYPFTPL